MVNTPLSGARRVLVLVGPTASGKTDVSLRLASLLDGEIVSADSRQVYRYLDIGTAKPAPGQLAAVRHHFVDALLPDQEMNAGEYGEQGRRVIDEIFGRRKLPIVVGGSGLYVRSLIDGFFKGPGADPEYREALEARLQNGELPALLRELRRVDPESAARIDPTKSRRVVRALEVHHVTGMTLSEHQAGRAIAISFTPLMFGLEWDRKALYERIDRRCEKMIEEGLLREEEELERRGYTRALNALNTVGYNEARAFRLGKIDQGEMMRLFKQNSRRYGKRQLTWFRRDPRVRWIPMNEGKNADTAAGEIVRHYEETAR